MATVLIEMVGIRMGDGSWIAEALSFLNFAEKELSDICLRKVSVPSLPNMIVLCVKLVKQVRYS